MAAWCHSSSIAPCPHSETVHLSEVDEYPKIQCLAEQEGAHIRLAIDGLCDDNAGLVRDREAKSLAIRILKPQPHINILPYEILSAIFKFACTPRWFPLERSFFESRRYSFLLPENPLGGISIASALTLSAVSSYWRQVAISMSKLWQNLIISPKQYRPEPWANLLRLCADRSMTLDFSIDLELMYIIVPKRFRGSSPCLEPANAPPDEFQRAIFVEYPHMIRKLLLKFRPAKEMWLQLALLAPFTHMEELHLHNLTSKETFKGDIELSRFKEFCGRQLTILDLHGLPYDLCLGLICHCPKLVTYRCLDPSSPKQIVTRVDVKVILPVLEWLDVDVIQTRRTLQFGETSVPSARGIRWGCRLGGVDEGHLDGISSTLIRFLSSAKMLTELELSFQNLHAVSISEIFSVVPGVQKLALTGTRPQWSPDSPFIVALKKTTLTVPLPALHTLILRAHCYWMRGRIAVTDELFTIIRQRWELRLVPEFRVDVEFRQNWRDEVRAGLKELVREGLKLEIWMEYSRVGWLL